MREIGEELRRKREELGLELTDVQAATKIRLRYLQALEDGRPEVIPGDVFVKGFLRCYGDFLGLDGYALVERYKASTAADPAGNNAGGNAVNADMQKSLRTDTSAAKPMKEPVIGQMRSSTRRYSGTPRRVSGKLVRLLVLVVIGLLVYVSFHKEKAGEGERVARVEESGANTGGDYEKYQGDETLSTPTNRPTSSEITPAPTVPTSEQAIPHNVTVTRVIYGNRVTYSVESDSLKVEARAVDPCWLRVLADGRLVYEGKLMPDTPIVWSASQGIALRAGNPPALRLVVNGRPLDPLTLSMPADITFSVARPSGEAYEGPTLAHIN